MNPVLERVRAEVKATLNEKTYPWPQVENDVCLMHVRCLKHDEYPAIQARDGTVTFFCGCVRRATQLE